ncbi:hypothetical protein ES319_D11G208700v1 [Gossypium barbadense]|uniref:K-box domain-containing protein n=2 Tax=Gossypium TaxID=3633 RepID=A0A5J5PCS7_GOSBA|nr:hypothetical protein ES319_D11G208700v1 [Gossypium barbadense]TYG45993.1 hypothetical protein ES288_D11G220500v1 [Gossypium darwinii]
MSLLVSSSLSLNLTLLGINFSTMDFPGSTFSQREIDICNTKLERLYTRLC